MRQYKRQPWEQWNTITVPVGLSTILPTFNLCLHSPSFANQHRCSLWLLTAGGVRGNAENKIVFITTRSSMCFTEGEAEAAYSFKVMLNENRWWRITDWKNNMKLWKLLFWDTNNYTHLSLNLNLKPFISWCILSALTPWELATHNEQSNLWKFLFRIVDSDLLSRMLIF